jgi:hypothetical protein
MSTEETTVVDLNAVTEEDLNGIRKKNEQRLVAIRNQKIDLGNLADVVVSNRLDTFLDLFLTAEQRVQFEYAFEIRMQEMLLNVLAQVRKNTLTQGVTSSGLVLPGRG